MTEPWENPELCKATVQIEKELYERVTTRLHYGQLSTLLRNMFESMDDMIKDGKLMHIVKYIQKEGALTLKPSKGVNDVTNGSDQS